jgi:hypothetical protein
MFNSPLHYCTKCKQYVELDQTKEQCAASHGCDGRNCPLEGVFRPAVPASPPTDSKPAGRK